MIDIDTQYLLRNHKMVSLRQCLRYPWKTGVYIILLDKQVKYIGASKSVKTRLSDSSHKRRELILDRNARFIFAAQVDWNTTLFVEQALIKMIDPSGNNNMGYDTRFNRLKSAWDFTRTTHDKRKKPSEMEIARLIYKQYRGLIYASKTEDKVYQRISSSSGAFYPVTAQVFNDFVVAQTRRFMPKIYKKSFSKKYTTTVCRYLIRTCRKGIKASG